MSDFHIHQHSTSNKPWRRSRWRPGAREACRPREGEAGAASYLFNWDGSPAPDAVRATLQALLLLVGVAPFPRLQNENRVSVRQGVRLAGGAGSAFICAVLQTRAQRPRGPHAVPAGTRARAPAAGRWFSGLRGCVTLRRIFSTFPPQNYLLILS